MKYPFFLRSILFLTALISLTWAGSAYAGSGHAHFGRSEFVNGGMSPNEISQSLADIRIKTDYAKELLESGDLTELEEVAHSIRDLSSWVADNASMNRARHAGLKRASKGISRAAEKLKKYVVKGDLPKAEEQMKRIDKLLDFAV